MLVIMALPHDTTGDEPAESVLALAVGPAGPAGVHWKPDHVHCIVTHYQHLN